MFMRLYEMILSPLENRMLRAYRKRNDLDLQVFIDMSDRERADLFHNIAKSFPVPETENGYFYHGTSKDRLSSIKLLGLTNTNEGRWGNTTVGREHSSGRVFFTPDFDRAEWYASRWTKNPLYLRVHSSDLSDRHRDPEEPDAIYVNYSVPSSTIELWNGKKWAPIN